MSNIIPTAQRYTIDDLAALLRLDFADRGTLATVDADEWGPEKMRGGPVVILSYARGTFAEPAGSYHAAVDIDTLLSDGTPGVSRPILDKAQGYVLRVHAPARGNAEGKAAGARRATDMLAEQTLRAIARANKPFRETGEIEWPGKDDPDVLGYDAWTYGSLCRIRLVIATPVLDDALGTGTQTAAETSTSISLDGGATFPASDPPYDQPVN